MVRLLPIAAGDSLRNLSANNRLQSLLSFYWAMLKHGSVWKLGDESVTMMLLLYVLFNKLAVAEIAFF